MRSFGRVGVLVALCAVASTGALAQDARLRAFVQPDSGFRVDQTLRLVLEVEGAGRTDMEPPRIDGLKNLRVISGPERRFNSVWTNGRFSSKGQLVYTLAPLEAGPAEIPALTLAVNGRERSTQPIRLTVGAAGASVTPPRRTPTTRRDDGTDSAVFVRADLGVTDVRIGEVVPLTLLLYTDEPVGNPDLVDSPSLTGFWAEDVPVDAKAESYEARVEGRPFTVYPLVRKLLVPQAAGEIEIEPFTLNIPVRRRSRDPFRLFQLDRTQEIVRRTKPRTVRVRPLPTEGRPDDFSGAVGAFTLEVEVDRTAVAVNEAVTLTARVKGEGSLRSIVAPVVEAPPDLKVFEPDSRHDHRFRNGTLQSEREWEWVLVPLAAGELTIPELRFSYFDPAKDRYVVESAAAETLLASKSSQRPDESVSRQDVRLERRELAYIKPMRAGKIGVSPAAGFRSRWFLLFAALPVVWTPLWIWAGRHRAHLRENSSLVRGRKARSMARRRLVAAQKTIEETGSGFYEEVSSALLRYVADRSDRSAAGLTHDEVDALFSSRGIDDGLRKSFRGCVEACDFARFVPGHAESGRRAEVLADARELIERLEKAW